MKFYVNQGSRSFSFFKKHTDWWVCSKNIIHNRAFSPKNALHLIILLSIFNPFLFKFTLNSCFLHHVLVNRFFKFQNPFYSKLKKAHKITLKITCFISELSRVYPNTWLAKGNLRSCGDCVVFWVLGESINRIKTPS